MASRIRSLQALVAALTGFAAGCIQSPSKTASDVFVGRLPDDVTYQPFKNTSGANVGADATTCYPDTTLYCPDGGASLKVKVPGPGDPNNFFAGGTLVAGLPRNLSGYDAVTFWAKSTRGAPLVVGLGADQSDNPLYLAQGVVSLSTTWSQYILPIPLATKLTAEKGLFFFSAGADGSPATGFTFWLANIQFATLGTALGAPTPVLAPACVKKAVGDGVFPAFPAGASTQIPVAFTVNAATEVVNASSRYFTFSSSDSAVATVDVDGIVQVNGPGTATVTAGLGGNDAAGPLTVKVNTADPCPALAVPTTPAPTPTLAQAKVLSLFSSSYQPSPGIVWQTVWSVCCSEYAQLNIGTHPVKKYTLRAFAGIGFGPDGSNANLIDASKMTHFHVDVWTPNAFAFQVKLVNDPNGFKSESTVQVDLGSTPPLEIGKWVGVEIPMTAFRNLGGTSKLGQMLFIVPDGTSAVFYVDNVYFHN
jgi:hypothetical protein